MLDQEIERIQEKQIRADLRAAAAILAD